MCVAKYSEDERWYRAKVLSVDIQEDKVEVYYVDYGNIELVAPSDVRTLVAELTDLPVQTVRCSIADVCPISAAWSPGKLDFNRLYYSDEVYRFNW